MANQIVSFSRGKDSTAMLLRMLERGEDKGKAARIGIDATLPRTISFKIEFTT